MVIRKNILQPHMETKIQEIIKKGGSSTSNLDIAEPHKLTLRIPRLLKMQVEEMIASDPIEPSLTAWILDAMKQKLNHDRKD